MDAPCKCPKCGRDWIADVPTGERKAKIIEEINDPAVTANIPDWSTAKEWQAYKFWYSDLTKPAPSICLECEKAGHHFDVRIESDTSGKGRVAVRGDAVTVSYKVFLYRVFLDTRELIQSKSETFTIGQRRVIAGLECGVEGMQVGGRRRFRVGPHLAYGDAGVEGLVPPDAVLVFDVELLSMEPTVPPAS